MRVLTAYYKKTGGGCFKRLVRLINACVTENWSTHYISAEPFESASPEAVFHKVPLLGNQYLIALYYMIILPFRITVLARRERIDRLVAIGFPYAFSFLLARLVLGTPLTILIRGDWIQELESSGRSKLTISVARSMQALSATFAERIICNSASLSRRLGHSLPARCASKLSVVVNDLPAISESELAGYRRKAATLRKEIQIPEDGFLMGYSGTLKPVKELEVLIRAFNQIRELPTTLLIIGDGTLKEDLKALCSELNLSSRILFTGWLEDPLQYVANLDLLILPTKSEGCPNSILEALACEIPCIASKVTGVIDVLTDPCLLFPSGSADALAEVLRDAVSSRDKYKAIVEASRKCADKFRLDWHKEILGQIHPYQ